MMSSNERAISRLFRNSMFRTWVFVNIAARFPSTMGLLLLMLLGKHLYGSLSVGALMAGGYTLCIGLFARWRGQQLDRKELRSGLVEHMTMTALMGIALSFAVWFEAPVYVVFPMVAIQGILSAAIPGGLRSILQSCVTTDQLEAANTMEAVINEVAFVSGPAIAGVLGMFFGPFEVLLFQTAGFVAAAIFMRFLPLHPPAKVGEVHGKFVLLYTGATGIYYHFFIFGACFGIFDGAIPKHMLTFGMTEASAGLVMPIVSIGSIVSGIIAVNISGALRVGRPMASALFMMFSLSFIGPALSTNIWLFVVLLFFVGLPIAPGVALANLGLQHILPNEQRSEGFAMASSVILLGAGFAQSVTGLLLNYVDTHHLMMAIAVLPLSSAAIISINVVMRRRAGKPMGMGYPLDPDILDPAIPISERPDVN